MRLLLSGLTATLALISQPNICAQEKPADFEFRSNLPLHWGTLVGDARNRQIFTSDAAIEASGLAFTKGDLYVLCEKLSSVLRFRAQDLVKGTEQPFFPIPELVSLIDKDGNELNPELEAISILSVEERGQVMTRAYVCDEKALQIFEFEIQSQQDNTVKFVALRTITIPSSPDPSNGVNSAPVPKSSTVAKGIEGMEVFQKGDALMFYLLDEQDETAENQAMYAARLYRGSLASGETTITLDGRPYAYDQGANVNLRMTELTTRLDENGSLGLYAIRSNKKTAYDLVKLDPQTLDVLDTAKIEFRNADDDGYSTNFEGAAFNPAGELFLVTDSGAGDDTGKLEGDYTLLSRYILVPSELKPPREPSGRVVVNSDQSGPPRHDGVPFNEGIPHPDGAQSADGAVFVEDVPPQISAPYPDDDPFAELVAYPADGPYAVNSDAGLPLEMRCTDGVPCQTGVTRLRLPAVHVHNRQTVPMSKRMVEIWMTFPEGVRPSVSVNYAEYPFEGRVRVFRSSLRHYGGRTYRISARYLKAGQWVYLAATATGGTGVTQTPDANSIEIMVHPGDQVRVAFQ